MLGLRTIAVMQGSLRGVRIYKEAQCTRICEEREYSADISTLKSNHHTKRASSMSLPLIAVGLLLLYKICVIIHRLYLSPLAAFPGPKIAGKTV